MGGFGLVMMNAAEYVRVLRSVMLILGWFEIYFLMAWFMMLRCDFEV